MSFNHSPSYTPMSDEVMHVQNGLSDVTLEEISFAPLADTASSWSDDETKSIRFENLRNVALGNCRLLYGSERMKFYDIVLGMDEDETEFCAALICSREGTSKVLRATSSDCPVKAIRALTIRLQKDSMPLLVKGGAGVMMAGQQGYTEPNGTWVWSEMDKVARPGGAADDTETLPPPPGKRTDSWRPHGAPRGPRSDRSGYKRPRWENDQMQEASDGLGFYE